MMKKLSAAAIAAFGCFLFLVIHAPFLKGKTVQIIMLCMCTALFVYLLYTLIEDILEERAIKKRRRKNISWSSYWSKGFFEDYLSDENFVYRFLKNKK